MGVALRCAVFSWLKLVAISKARHSMFSLQHIQMEVCLSFLGMQKCDFQILLICLVLSFYYIDVIFFFF